MLDGALSGDDQLGLFDSLDDRVELLAFSQEDLFSRTVKQLDELLDPPPADWEIVLEVLLGGVVGVPEDGQVRFEDPRH